MVDGSTTLLREALEEATPAWCGAMVAALAARANRYPDDADARNDVEVARKLADAMPAIFAALQSQPTGADDDYSKYDDPRWNDGVQHVIDLLAKTIGSTDWVAGDGSEDYDEDLATTLLNILAAKGLYDRDEGTFATFAPPSSPDRLSAEDGNTLAYIRGFVSEKAKSESSLVKKLRRFLEMYDRLSRQPEAGNECACGKFDDGKVCPAPDGTPLCVNTGQPEASEPVAWQWLHTDPISGDPLWIGKQFWNGHHSEKSRPLYAYSRSDKDPVAWIDFADNGNIRFWTADPARADREAMSGRVLCNYTVSQLVAMIAARPRLDREKDRVFGQMLDALKLIRMYVKEGGMPRYTVTPGAGLNSAIEESVDPAIKAADAIMRETR